VGPPLSDWVDRGYWFQSILCSEKAFIATSECPIHGSQSRFQLPIQRGFLKSNWFHYIPNRHTVYQHRHSPQSATHKLNILAARKSISNLPIIIASKLRTKYQETENIGKSATADPRRSFSAQQRMHFLRGIRKVIAYFDNKFKVRILERENEVKEWNRFTKSQRHCDVEESHRKTQRNSLQKNG